MSACPNTLPRCRAPHGLAQSSGGVLVYYTTHCIRRLLTADLTCGIDCRRVLPPVAEPLGVSCVPQPPPGRTLCRVSTRLSIVLSPIGINWTGDIRNVLTLDRKDYGETPPTLGNLQISKPRDTNFRRKAPSTLV